MKHHIKTMLLVISLISFCCRVHAQTVAITSPDPTASATVINESEQSSGMSLVAQATPANGADGECVTFDWTDQYGGDWGPGTLSADGLTSTLTYYPPGGAYGTQVTMSVTVQDNVNPQSSPATVNVIVPMITIPSSCYQLSYYGGAEYEDSDAGNGETYLNVTIAPTPSTTGVDFTWSFATAPGLTNAPDGSGEDNELLNSVNQSGEPGDQDVQLMGPDGSEAADQALTVQEPTATNQPQGPNDSPESSTSWIPPFNTLKGWYTSQMMQATDQWTLPVPVNTQILESFDSITDVVSGENWYLPAYAASWATWSADSSGLFTDEYEKAPGSLASPAPLWPTDSGAGSTVMTRPQYYSGGALPTDSPAGVTIDSHTLDYNYGNGRQVP
jgi:hypothetical protein